MILVTGAAGFIGSHVSQRLLERGDTVVGLDNVNEYYDPTLKEARLARLMPFEKFTFYRQDLSDRAAMKVLFESRAIRQVVHLAAQAGVRYSLVNPYAYTESNIEGFLNILENCRHANVEHLLYASSSSVYGSNTQMPFSVRDNVDHPVSLYAATKKANELMAHTYSHLFNLPCSGLRFFTVYGPWGRPDMALFIFTKAILEDKPIDLFNFGKMKRDFTYVDDIVTGIMHVLDKPADPDSTWSGDAPKPESSVSPYRLYNIGSHRPVELLRFVEIIEEVLGKKAIKNLKPIQPGDVPSTHADVRELMEQYSFQPNTPLEEGIKRFIEWYREYYKA
ncbi:MAG: capsular biosynthesis protein CpsI [Nitrospiraceae bacterium]|nr:capsular biosynthesis protein CpsI [Nitrospiraceae bacterium]|tara:strand:+ start:1795 stop:2799 length:1005 start_codon:yes stop_codon:yes gene_type:complete